MTNHRVRQAKIVREAEGYLELGMSQYALDTLARLGDPAKFSSYALYLWGEALRVLERYEEAIMPLVRSAEAAPGNVPVWFALGWCYKRTGQIDLAIASLEQALESEPAQALVHYNLACYWSLAGNKERAMKYLSRSLAIDPQYVDLIDSEPDFDLIRREPDFLALCEELRARQ